MVGVDGWVGEGQNRWSVLQDSADVPASSVAQTTVTRLVVEQRLAIFPEGLVDVHTRAVVTKERLRHKGCGLSKLVGHVLDDVLELQDVVGALDQLVKAVVDLALTSCSYLVVGALY